MKPRQVLNFWFGENPDNAGTPARQAQLWWGKREADDREIRDHFERLLVQIATGHRRQWLQVPESRLAGIIVLDQFSRAMYRDDPKAFGQDMLARFWCLEGMELGHDKMLPPIQRFFYYLPLEHSESLSVQNLAVEKIGGLRGEVEDRARPHFEDFYNYALRHRDVIAEFGRFPHRNAILGRKSTPAEREFLAKPGSRF